ncbi:RNA polymerase ECF-type sigma factor [Aquipluma nitroreducens]|uniref:RNA polymerase ECF-type sigma factor n=1 Tax=Aquipluma nitroreducens TaxID=2010828 RepID=A0A5K7SDF5_9BACT|nr:RNA polymerase sigma-70 factor [Aquipluma nitroreducens]BBE19486.1 RNA polymerase ECF-type sigma factor [Aquipluma nitroreducens]
MRPGSKQINEEHEFELIFRKYYVRLCGFANKFIANTPEAEEIVQEVFLNIWAKRDRLKLNDEIKPYLFKSVQNICFNFIEHQKVVDNYYSVIEVVYKNKKEEFDTYESVLFTEFQAKVDEAIGSLPEECRKIFKMSREDGLKYAEIADKLNLSVKTVETQMSRALSKLKTELKDYLCVLIVSLFLNN